MRRLLLAASAAAALLAAPLVSGPAAAAPLGAARFLGAAQDLNIVEQAQYVYRGHKHCWYADGWSGAGWFRCGYRWRRGLGYGGPAGWMGWGVPGAAVVVRPVRPRYRRPVVVVRP